MTDRLLRLADHLDTVQPEAFKLLAWRLEKQGCGTVACACGHGCDIPEFRDAGLKLERSLFSRDDQATEYFLVYTDPVLKAEYECFEAVQEFFGITAHDADYLFEPSSYDHGSKTTAVEVAARIRDFFINGTPPE
jgi:hypothetical protein